MKKLMAASLGLALLSGSAMFAGQNTSTSTDTGSMKSSKKHKKSKKSDTTSTTSTSTSK